MVNRSKLERYNPRNDVNDNFYFQPDVCNRCNSDKQFATTCKCSNVVYNGVEYSPIKFGEEKFTDTSAYERCYDCNVVKDGYHHSGCEAEECPKCGNPILICKCS